MGILLHQRRVEIWLVDGTLIGFVDCMLLVLDGGRSLCSAILWTAYYRTHAHHHLLILLASLLSLKFCILLAILRLFGSLLLLLIFTTLQLALTNRMLRLSECARFLVKFVNQFLVEDLFLEGGVSELDGAQFSLKAELVVFENVLG